MKNLRFRFLGLLLLPLLCSRLPLAAKEIPDALKPWEAWATWDDEHRACPTPYSDPTKHLCFWPSRMGLQIEKTGAQFDVLVTVYHRTWVPLPGGAESWPQDVKANGAPIAVLEHEGGPALQLDPGTVHLTGAYRWAEIPQRIAVPPSIGILALVLDGQPVEAPVWDAEGFVWLKRTGSAEAADKNFLSVKLYAALEDGIPLWLRTEVELIVSGKSREEDLGTILPEGWKLATVESPLPVAVDEAGRMKAQVRAGKWTLHADAFRFDNPKEFSYAAAAKPAVEEELVAFRARPDFRTVEITGAPAIDVSQTTFPTQWRELPVFRWETTTALHLEERLRGMGEQKPEGLRIARELWLDDDGRALTFRDRINGQMQRIWRLDAATGQELGSVQSAGQGQLITLNPQTQAPGVEIRTRNLNLEATGRMPRAHELPATGWSSDADNLQFTLNLPPGWRLFALFGADWVRGDWLTAWTLLDLFLLLMFTLAVFRLWGFGAALLAGAAFALSFHEPGAPRYLWLVLLVPLALQRVVPEGWGRRLVCVGKGIVIVLLFFALVPFIARQVQQALYPQLERVRADYEGMSIQDPREAARYSSAAPGPQAEVRTDSTNTETMVTREIAVNPEVIGRGSSSQPAGDATQGGVAIAKREAAKDWLISNGAQFGPEASAIYIPSTGKLIVRNTPDQLDLIESIVTPAANSVPGIEGLDNYAQSGRSSWSSSRVVSKGGMSKDNLAYDAKARIQTGPGVPEWQWRQVSFGWNGPVTAAQQVRPVLISLGMERVLTILRVVLLISLAGVLLGARRLGNTVFRASGKTAALLVCCFTLVNATAQAQVPDKATLDQLRTRLLKVSDAFPHAAELPSVSLQVSDRKLVLEAEVHAAVQSAVPLPGRLPGWSPLTILVDDKPEVALRREDGYLWLVLPEGVHHVHVEGLLAGGTEWEWTFLLKPRQVKIDAPDWTFSGVKPDGTPEAQVFFTRKQKAAAGQASYDRQDLQSIASVDRRLELGLLWQVRTTVTRLSPTGKAVSLRVPLLPGENVLSSNAVVKDGAIEVRLGAQEESFTWESGLAIADHLGFATRPNDTWVETWYLVASPVWNVTIAGLPPTFEPGGAELTPVWHPWPGEAVDLAISRPEAIAGATVTVSRAKHTIALGKRQRTSTLELSLRCSVGEDFLIELPDDADITSLIHNGKAIPVRKDGARLIIPLRPGEQTVAIGWKINTALGFRAQAEEIKLPVESANIQTFITVPNDRWTLWAAGPRRGPAVRFWGILLCSLLAALALGRAARSPIHTLSWMLLVIGLTQVPLPAALVVIAWLFLLGWRGGAKFQTLGDASYNILQVLLILATVASLGILITAVGEGLLGNPEMFVIGNDSSALLLRWFQARSGPVLPQPYCLSISIWWYRLFMLVWALWLAAALLRWLRWGWQNFSAGGFFRKPAAPAPRPPGAPPTPPTPPGNPPVPPAPPASPAPASPAPAAPTPDSPPPASPSTPPPLPIAERLRFLSKDQPKPPQPPPDAGQP